MAVPATSGLANFGVSTEFVDTITEAFERCGKDAAWIDGVKVNSALRSINFMFSDWANLGPNLFAVDQLRFTLELGKTAYTLPIDTVNILQAVVRNELTGVNQQDVVLTAISRAEYFNLPNKLSTGDRPTQFYVERTNPPVVYIWPVPDNSLKTFIYYRMRMIQDAGSMTKTPDAPARWAEAIASGLAARLAVKWAPDRYQLLAGLAATAYTNAAVEDTESVPIRIAPDFEGRD